MTEKLLSRPPFRYIHDIISATIQATGFGEGIFVGDETNSKAIQDKEQKMLVLQKIIDLTQMVLQQEVDVETIKIVAGKDCEKTNYFLQAFYQAATAGVDSGPIVAQILANYGQGEGGEEAPADEGGDDGAEEQAAAEAEAAEQARQQQEAEEEERRRRKKEKKRRMMEEQQ